MSIELDGANHKLKLDNDGDTYLEAHTDDTIKVYVSGAEDLRIAANAINVLSGTTLTIDSGATITNSGTANGFGSNEPSSADGQALGSASAEWSDLFLADGGTIQFGNDQEVRLIHTADTGLILKHTATADDKPISLTLQTGETDIAQDDVIGKIDFQAPDEGTGTDAILVAAGIEAVSEGDFSSSNNATKLSFKTAASEAAAEKMSLSSAGLLTVANGVTVSDGDVTVASGHGISFAATTDATTMASELLDDYEEGTFNATLATGGGSASINSSYNECSYIKIGGSVTIGGTFHVNSVSSPTGLMTIGGLPFASAGNNRKMQIWCYINECTGTISNPQALMQGTASTFAMHDKVYDSTGSSGDIANHLDSDTWVSFSGTYFVI